MGISVQYRSSRAFPFSYSRRLQEHPSSNASNHELLVISLSGTAHSFRYFVYSVLGAFQDAHVRQLDGEYWSSNSTLHFNAGIQMRHSETVLFCAFFTRFRLERGPFPLF
jgi:hypothetical protein